MKTNNSTPPIGVCETRSETANIAPAELRDRPHPRRRPEQHALPNGRLPFLVFFLAVVLCFPCLGVGQVLPPAIDHSAGLPPVANQGAQHSSHAWALAYYYKTFQEGQARGWAVDTPDHQFSPAFLYHQVAPQDEGASFAELLPLLADQGCATLADMPYDAADSSSWPPYLAFHNALQFRIQDFALLGDGLTPGIVEVMKTLLAGGGLCVLEVPVFKPDASAPGFFERLNATNSFYNMPDSDDVYLGPRQALTVVGYDDTAFGGAGGFKVVNSWGTSWGNQGYAWLSSQFIQAFATDIGIMQPRANYQPTSIARFKLAHPFWGWNYDNVTVTIGVGDPASPRWSKVILTGLERESLTVDMAVDLTEAAAFLPPSAANRWWIKVDDSSREDVGLLSIFQIEHAGTTYDASVVLPLTGPFFTGSFYAFLPAGEPASAHYYVNDGSTNGDQYCTAIGDDANDGLTPATPLRTVQAVIDRYTLKAGDAVWVDAGLYQMTNDVQLTQLDRGAEGNPIRFVGVIASNGEPATILDRGTGGGVAFNLNGGARFIELDNFWLRGGQNGVSFDGSWDYGTDGLTLNNCRVSRTAGDAISLYEAGSVELVHCRIHDYRGSYGINVYGSSAVLQQSTITASTNQTAALVYESSSGYASGASMVCSNSILYASGPGARCAMLSGWILGANMPAYWSCLFATNGAVLGSIATNGNLLLDPLLASPVGGDFHLRSTAGRWNPAANGGAGGFVNDAVNSPAIDAGDPLLPVGDELAPNGGRLNIGAFGGTAFASKSPDVRYLTLTAPQAGATNFGAVTVTWMVRGAGWSVGDTLRLEYSSDGGTNFAVVAGAAALRYATGSFSWSARTNSPGTNYVVRLVSNEDSSLTRVSGVFTIGGVRDYYVNDASTANDAYCTAPGNDANDGLTPATPKATVQAILGAYNLERGDTVYVDTGIYSSSNAVEIADADGGSAEGRITIKGSPRGSVFRRLAPADGYIPFEPAVFLITGAWVGLERLTITGSRVGVRLAGPEAALRHCLFVSNYVGVLHIASISAGVTNCTFVANQYGAFLWYYSGLSLWNCIFDLAGQSAFAIFEASSSVASDYNCYHLTNSGWVGNGAQSLANWQTASGQDAHSLSADPLFVDPITGNYHLQSTGGSWHGGAFTADAANSPCLDVGDPAMSVGDEPSANGARINLGVYGGTEQASKTAAGRILKIVSPNGGEVWRGTTNIVWQTTGQSWSSGDMLRLEYSSDGGTTWTPVAGATAVPYAMGQFGWDTLPVASGSRCRVRGVCNQDPATQDASDANFAIHNTALNYYVNDGSTANDAYCTAPGNDANDGLTPATPKATVQAILDAYDLEPGDTVYVDTGFYLVPQGIALTDAADAGRAGSYVTLQGSPHRDGTVLSRGNNNGAVLQVASDYWRLQDLRIGNGTWGIRYLNSASYHGEIVSCTIYSNTVSGVDSPDWYANWEVMHLRIAHCVLYGNPTGVSIATRGTDTFVENCTVRAHGGVGVNGAREVRHTIVHASGSGAVCVAGSGNTGYRGDWNDFYATEGAQVSSAGPGMEAWRVASGQDQHSLSADPLFANPSSGDFHLRSTGGRWDPATQSFLTDAVDSPALDAGDPTAPVGSEVAPNGGRLNLGAYGGTSQASKSPTKRALTLVSPNGGEVWRGAQTVRWLATGQGWTNTETVRIEYSVDGGSNWTLLAAALPFDAGTFSWDTVIVPSGARYRVRVSSEADPAVQDSSDSVFTIHNTGLNYYVNDGSTANDAYCTAAGDDANDGLTPATPKARLSAILSAYDLEPGDTVYVDTGIYLLTSNVIVSAEDGGSASGWVRLLGSPRGSRLNRLSTASGARVMEVHGDYVRVEGLQLTGGQVGLSFNVDTAPHGAAVGNVIYGNQEIGLEMRHYSYGFPERYEVRNNLIFASANGLVFSGGYYGEAGACVVSQNTVVCTNGTAVSVGGAVGASELTDNIIVASGATSYALFENSFNGPKLAQADFNLFLLRNGARVAQRNEDGYILTYTNLVDLQNRTGQHVRTLTTDPWFANEMAGDFHLLSTGGRWDPATQSFVTDALDSPAIDAGDPTEPIGSELVPNGGRLNLGAYGGTAEASKSPVGRALTLISPNGSEVWRGFRAVRWVASGQGWQEGDTVTLHVSSNGGMFWILPVGGAGVPASWGEFELDMRSLPPGSNYVIRVTSDQDAAIADTNRVAFTVQAGGVYYVNDASTAGDTYTTAPGNDLASGTTPATPKASLQSILNTYDLAPGDVVFVDAGTYTLANDVVIAVEDGGSVGTPVRIVGVKGKTILDRNAANTIGSTCLLINAPYVNVENLTCRRAYYGIQINSANCAVLNNVASGCGYHGILVNSARDAVLAHNIVTHSGAGAAVNLAATYLGGGDYAALPCTVINNTIVTTNADGIYSSAAGGPQVRNNIVQVSGAGRSCISLRDISGLTASDYNDLHPVNGAQIGKIYQANAPALFTWRALTSWDAHGLSVDPLFANPSGGDFHLKSGAGRFDHSTGQPPTDPGAWVTDSITSLAIDAGDPGDPFGDESLPNGGRINLGAYGGTTEASRGSSATRIVSVLSPNGGEVWSGFHAIELRATGPGLQSTDALRIEVSADGGVTWQTVPGGENLPATQTRFWWDTRTASNGSSYRLRVTVVQDGSAQDISDGAFRIANLVAPQILAQPISQFVPVGTNVNFAVGVNDTILLAYQWRKDGANIAGATNATLTLNNVTTNHAGVFTVVVSNPVGSVISDPATLNVFVPPLVFALDAPALLEDGRFAFRLSGPVGAPFVVRATTVFAGWTPIATNVIPAAGFMPILDATATNHAHRFYQVTIPTP